MSCNCGGASNLKFCQTCMPNNDNVFVPMNEVPDPIYATRNHGYVDKDNNVWVLNKDRTGFIRLGGSESISYVGADGIAVDGRTIRYVGKQPINYTGGKYISVKNGVVEYSGPEPNTHDYFPDIKVVSDEVSRFEKWATKAIEDLSNRAKPKDFQPAIDELSINLTNNVANIQEALANLRKRLEALQPIRYVEGKYIDITDNVVSYVGPEPNTHDYSQDIKVVDNELVRFEKWATKAIEALSQGMKPTDYSSVTNEFQHKVDMLTQNVNAELEKLKQQLEGFRPKPYVAGKYIDITNNVVSYTGPEPDTHDYAQDIRNLDLDATKFKSYARRAIEALSYKVFGDKDYLNNYNGPAGEVTGIGIADAVKKIDLNKQGIESLKARVEALENKEDKDTKYTAGNGLNLSNNEFSVNENWLADKIPVGDVADLSERVTNLESKDIIIDGGSNISDYLRLVVRENEENNFSVMLDGIKLATKLKELTNKQDKDTIYNDTDIKNRLNALENKPSSSNKIIKSKELLPYTKVKLIEPNAYVDLASLPEQGILDGNIYLRLNLIYYRASSPTTPKNISLNIPIRIMITSYSKVLYQQFNTNLVIEDTVFSLSGSLYYNGNTKLILESWYLHTSNEKLYLGREGNNAVKREAIDNTVDNSEAIYRLVLEPEGNTSIIVNNLYLGE